MPPVTGPWAAAPVCHSRVTRSATYHDRALSCQRERPGAPVRATRRPAARIACRWRRACGRARWTRSSARSTCWRQAARCAGRSRPTACPSMVLWGPPGSGKTTLAEVIARLTQSRFVALSAVTAGRGRPAQGRRGGATRRRRSARSCSSTRSIASTRASRTRCCRTSKRHGHADRRDHRESVASRSTRRCSHACACSRLRALGDAEIELIVRRALDDTERGLGGTGPRHRGQRAAPPGRARQRRRARGAERARAGRRRRRGARRRRSSAWR